MNKYLIGGIYYPVGEKYLLCSVIIVKEGVLFDPKAKTKNLYYSKGKVFILETIGQITGDKKVELLTKKQAQKFMDTYPSGININVYKQYFEEPKEI